jgi:hypothetical protein
MKKINYKMSVSDNDKMFLSLGAFGLLCLLWLRLNNPSSCYYIVKYHSATE